MSECNDAALSNVINLLMMLPDGLLQSLNSFRKIPLEVNKCL